MTQLIVKCDGCNAKLRFRPKAGRTEIKCPRCGGVIPLPPTESMESTSPKTATTEVSQPEKPSAARASATSDRQSRATTPSASPHGGRSKKLLLTVLVIGGLLLAGGAGWILANLNNSDEAVVDNSSTGAPVPVADAPAEQAAVVSNNDTAAHSSANGPGDAPNSAPESGTSVAAAAPEPIATKLEYQWSDSAEHIYKFEVQADIGNKVKRFDGTCTFFVKSKDEPIGVEEEGSGTGFAISANGIIATCAHVVEGAEKIEVVINRQTYIGNVLAIVEADDLALIQIPAQNLAAVTFGDSDAVELAENIRAIGYPLSDVLGTEAKVATGSVAGIGADRNAGSRIQIDAPINPGNSGGPVVNDFGQVIAIASARLTGSLVSSVGFAIPVNRLKQLAEQHGHQITAEEKREPLAAPQIVRKVVPSVAYIKVWGGNSGTVQNLTFKAVCTERGDDGKTAVETQRDEGKLRVNTRGEIIFTSADEHLPMVLGPIASFFFEPIDRSGAASWQTEYETALHRIQRTEGGGFGPFGGFGPPVSGFGGRGGPGGGRFGSPFGRSQPQKKTVDILPATERTSYIMSEPVDGKVKIEKTYLFVTTRDPDSPYLKIHGKGDLIFDQNVGLPVSLNYKATIEQRSDGDTFSLPLRVSYERRNPADVEQERQDAEQERTVPNIELVNELLAELKQAGANAECVPVLTRLSQVAVVPEMQAEVLQNVNEYRAQNDRQMKTAGEQAFANWADQNEVDALKKIYTYALSPAKNQAYSRLCSFGPKYFPEMVAAMAHQHLNGHVKSELVKIGPAIEDEILTQINGFNNWVPKSVLINVLEKVGTEKSIPVLEEFLNQGVGLKVAAQHALRFIRARQ